MLPEQGGGKKKGFFCIHQLKQKHVGVRDDMQQKPLTDCGLLLEYREAEDQSRETQSKIRRWRKRRRIVPPSGGASLTSGFNQSRGEVLE